MGLVEDYYKLQDENQEKYGEKTIVLMQKGKFYEIYEYDPEKYKGNDPPPWPTRKVGHATEISTILNMTLTRTNKHKEYSIKNPNMVGFPIVSYQKHRDVLLDNNYTIIKIDEEKTDNGIKRVVTGIVSPATNIDNLSSIPLNNCIVSIYIEVQKENHRFEDYIITVGISSIDVTTGSNLVSEIYSKENDAVYGLQEIHRFLISNQPRQVLVHIYNRKNNSDDYKNFIFKSLELDTYQIYMIKMNSLNDNYMKACYHRRFLSKMFPDIIYEKTALEKIIENPQITEELGIERLYYGTISYIVLLQYCYEHNERLIEKIQKPYTKWIDEDLHLILTHNAIKQLDIRPNLNYVKKNKKVDSLFSVVNYTSTGSGKRLLLKMLNNPITDINMLKCYYNMTEDLINNKVLLNNINSILNSIPDIERYQRKLYLKLIRPTEFSILFRAYSKILDIINLILESNTNLNSLLFKQFDEFKSCLSMILKTYKLDSLFLSKLDQNKLVSYDGIFCKDVNSNSETYKSNIKDYYNKITTIVTHLNTFLVKSRGKKLEYIENTKKENTPLSLFTTPYKSKILEKSQYDESICGKLHFINVNKESMITSDIIAETCSNLINTKKEYQQYMYRCYMGTINDLINKYTFYQGINKFVSTLDFIKSNALAAIRNNYYKPNIKDNVVNSYFDIKDLRHPIIEKIIDSEYVSNDLELGKNPNGLLLYGSNSSGKCLAINTPILSYSGNIILSQNVKVGDKLMGDDSTPRTVISTTKGKDIMFEVNYKNGKFKCTGEHILVLKERINGVISDKDIEITVYDYLNKSEVWTKNKYLFRTSVEFDEKPINIDPYILGYIVGTEQVLSSSYVERFVKWIKPNSDPKYTKYCIKGEKFKVNLDSLNEYYINNNKHIPNNYKYNTTLNRRKLLAGIIDSDITYADESGYKFHFNNAEGVFALDVIYLIRSLGYECHTYKNSKEIIVNLKADNFEDLPIILTRRSFMFNPNENINEFSIKSIGFQKYYGFETDGNHKFLLGDFIVTHNSSLTKAVGLNIILAQAGLYTAGNITFKPYNKIITRLSGDDNLFQGESSFVIEMKELRTILRNSDEHTLVLGDELTRGTDSISGTCITVAAIESLIDLNSSFIFATHMHKIVDLPFIKNLPPSSLQISHLTLRYDDSSESLIYDRKLKDGSGDSIYGIEVAKSLSINKKFINRTLEIRKWLLNREKNSHFLSLKKSRHNSKYYLDSCLICGTEKPDDLITHHKEEQCKSNENGFIRNFHKNIPGNLIQLCEKCHVQLHSNGWTIESENTSKGTKYKIICN